MIYNKTAKYLSLLTAVCLLVFSFGCGMGDDAVTRDIFAMDTLIKLTVYGKNADESLDAAKERITQLESAFSATDSTSDVAKINAGGTVTVSDDTSALIEQALDVSKTYGGAFTIAVMPLVREWGFLTKEYNVPSAERLKQLTALVKDSRVTVSGNTVSCSEGAQIDLGAIAKGYASQSVIELLGESGVSAAVVSLGGNVQTLGAKPDGSPWSIAIVDPLSPESGTVGTLHTGETAVVTSGSYQRFFEQDGKTYHHIIDPFTGAPSDSGLLSVTVICENGARCDAISTALFVSGLQKSLEYYTQTDEFEAVFITDDRRVIATDGIKDSFTFTGGETYTYE